MERKQGEGRRSAEQLEVERDRLRDELAVERERADSIRARLEHALARQQREEQLILDSVPAMIWFKDRHNRIIRCNHAAAATAGVSVADMEGRLTEEFYPDEAGIYLADDLEVIRSGRPKLGIIEPHRTASGEKLWVRTDKVPWVDGEGNVVGVLVFATDITPLKRAEEERGELLARAEAARADAEAASRMKEEFLATVSHELRTPLNAMLGYATLLREGRLDAVQRARAEEAIERNARSQAKLIDDLLDVSRIIAGRLRLHLVPVDLLRVVRAAVESVRPAADARSVRLRTIVEATTTWTSGDADRLQQVVWNLLSNAIKFTGPGGQVDVRIEPASPAHLRIAIADTGRGIGADFLPHVFDRFRQADSSTTRRFGGLGLGLAIVRHLVELHGGQVRAESAGEGRGSTFTVELPLRAVDVEEVAAHAVAAPTPAERAALLGGVRVLLVEDDTDTRQLVTLVLEESGARVEAVASAAEALRSIAALRPDVLISDIAMPDMDGYELLRRLRQLPDEAAAPLPAVAMTAYTREEDRQRALAAGYHSHLGKPIAPDQLLRMVAQAVGRKI